jgi:hypothetical protein
MQDSAPLVSVSPDWGGTWVSRLLELYEGWYAHVDEDGRISLDPRLVIYDVLEALGGRDEVFFTFITGCTYQECGLEGG